jgi:hypothetical protein
MSLFSRRLEPHSVQLANAASIVISASAATVLNTGRMKPFHQL